MVRRLDRDDLGRNTRRVAIEVVEELSLCRRWSQYQHLVGRPELVGDVGEEARFVLGVGVRLGSVPRVAVQAVLRRLEPSLVEAVEINVEDTGLVVIEPYRGAFR